MKNIFKIFISGLALCLLVVVGSYFYKQEWVKDRFSDTQEKVESVDRKPTTSATYSQLTDEPVTKQLSVVQNGWELIWRDEFNGVELNDSKWSAEDWESNKNKELQYYLPENVSVERGNLILTSKKQSYGGKEYTSGAVHTKDKLDITYGKIEMRAKLPAGQGFLPAFWLMTNREDTWLPEIDIVEMLGSEPKEIWMVLHWLNKNHKLKSVNDSYKGVDFSKDFHTYGVEWTEDSVAWFIDGVERFRTDAFIPTEPMYIYINTAIGGVWPGSPDESTNFPTKYEVDYVRVYQKEGV